MATMFHRSTTNNPKAIVREKSLVGDRKSGTASAHISCIVIDERIGATEKRFDMIIRINNVKTIERRIFFLMGVRFVTSILDLKKL